jgi:hypothetical protein
MIKGKPQLNTAYYSKVLGAKFNLTEWEKRTINKYFWEEMLLLQEQEIDFENPEILLIIDIIRFHNCLEDNDN